LLQDSDCRHIVCGRRAGLVTQNSDKCVKKLYQEPVLVVYGCIEAMTLAAGKTTMIADGGPNSTKTA
jgi:hypothetical protein